jgi:hypothetical protein
MSKLTKMLEYSYAGNTEKKRMANSESFKKTVLDTVPKTEKELLLTEGMESTTLLQTEVYNTILEGAQPEMTVRNIFPVIKTDTNQIRLTYESGALAKAGEVAEGAAIPIHTENFDTKNINIKKIGVRPVITNELIEDGLWNMVEFELKRAGQKIEHKLNYDVIQEAIDKDSYSNIASVDAGSAFTVQNILDGIAEINYNHYKPTDLILTPWAENRLVSGNNLLQANYAGDNQALRNYNVGNLFGLKMHRLSTRGESTDTYKWAGIDGKIDTAYDVSALLCDPSYCMIGMRRDISVEQYDDPIHDLVGIAATMRYGVKTIEGKKACIIEH